MDSFLALSQRVKSLIETVLGTLAAVMMLILTLFALLEIVRRYLFDVVFEWGQDAMIVGMIATVSIYFAVTQIRRSHLVMNAVIQLLHSRGYYRTVGVLKILVSALIVIFCTAIGITGWSTLTYAFERDLMTYSLLIPLWPFFLTLMFGFLLMAFIALLQLVEDIIAFARKEYLDGEIELVTDV
ncbi:MAG: TRAP transporter small permease [Gammaproteobacteria bacterium]|nr:TRAP transporter small permease [Gammaproteobacteria bacterium]